MSELTFGPWKGTKPKHVVDVGFRVIDGQEVVLPFSAIPEWNPVPNGWQLSKPLPVGAGLPYWRRVLVRTWSGLPHIPYMLNRIMRGNGRRRGVSRRVRNSSRGSPGRSSDDPHRPVAGCRR
jgi:hypothetical protein